MNGPETKRHGRRYPWEEWLIPGGPWVTLLHGIHFPADVQLHGMAQCLRNAAGRMGLRVSVRLIRPGPGKVGVGRIEVRVVGRRRRAKKAA